MTNEETTTQPRQILSPSQYDWAKRIVQLWLPASATLYFTLASIWDLPNPEGVVATAAALATFLGITLQVSSKRYEASGGGAVGVINVSSPTEDSTLYELELDGDPAELKNMSKVTFNVNQPDS